jgi:hypothetical protein
MIDHVRSTIIEYLASRYSANDLANRLPDGWELDEGGTPEARLLTLKAIGYLAEFQRGDRSEAALRDALITLVVGPARAIPGSKRLAGPAAQPAPVKLETVGSTSLALTAAA